MKLHLVLLLVAAACAAPADDNVWDFEMDELEKITDFLETKEDLIEFLTEGKRSEKVQLTSFSFEDCGSNATMTKINSVTITPDPVELPGTITVGTNFMIKQDFGMPLSVSLLMKKKFFNTFIKVPCIANFGSCTYNDLCGDLEQVTCPDSIVKIGIDCRCPFKKYSYTFPRTGFKVDASLPLPKGGYRIQVNAMSNGTQAACLDITFTLK